MPLTCLRNPELINLDWDDERVRVCLHPDKAAVGRSPQALGKVLKIVILIQLAELVAIVQMGYKPVLSVLKDARRDRAYLLGRVSESEPELLTLLRQPIVHNR